MRYVHGDLFDPPRPEPKVLPATRLTPRNTVESRPASDRDRSVDARVEHEVMANGMLGMTRNELYERFGREVSIQTLSWSFGRLFAAGRIFRRTDGTRPPDGKLRFVSRARCYVVYAESYRRGFLGTDCPPFDERAKTRQSA